MTTLPIGTVTFLFTDIEGSTRLLESRLDAYRAGLARHDAIIRQAVAAHAGVIVLGRGDGFCAAFASPIEAVRAALDAQLGLGREDWRELGQITSRMGLHTGEVELHGDEYFGAPLHRCARLMDCAHGGQVVLSSVTAALVGEALPPGVWLKDLGEHRLRDLIRPERIHQLVGEGQPADFPPLRTLTTIPNNLPMQATAFIGREQQLQAVHTLLFRSDVRLVTLTGPGGTGKTRLALQAAADLLDSFTDGVYFVPVASVTDPDLVLSAVAQALDVREAAGRPIAATLADTLRQKQLLVVLDNFEQVVAAAPLVAELLTSAPRVKILVTSRSVLHIYGERELSVPPLALPDHRTTPTAAHLAQFEAVHLFVDRAQAARSDFALTDENAPAVAEICQRLDGLPLAIELAAARVRALPPRAMLQRMERRLPLLTGGARDLPARQRTLSAAIAWSYDLLDPDEQVLFRRLAVFRGCTLESAGTVCSGDLPQPGTMSVALTPLGLDILDGIESLVEKSLLRQKEAADDQPWFQMLETVREYALERLDESGEADTVFRRHALAALRLAELSEPELYGPDQAIWHARLQQEHDNLRAALSWCKEHGYVQPALRLAVALWWFWSTCGHVQEGREYLDGLLAQFPLRASTKHTALYARVLLAAGMLASIQGDHVTARRRQSDGLALRRTIPDVAGLFAALEATATVACLQGDYAAARGYLEEALAIARQLGDRLSYGNVMALLGNVSHEMGDLDVARAYYEEGMASFSESEIETYRTLNSAMLSIATVALEQGAYDEALILANRALTGSERTSQRHLRALTLATLGAIALARGDPATAREHLHRSIGICQSIGDVAGVAQILERFVSLATAQGRFEGALRLASVSTALRIRAGAPRSPRGQESLDRALDPARQALSLEAAEAASQSDFGLDLDHAVAAALAITAPEPTEPSDTISPPVGRSAPSVLTRRELEVAIQISRGLTNGEIAEVLVITEGTTANHVNHILTKLDFSSRAQIAVWVTEQGLISNGGENGKPRG